MYSSKNNLSSNKQSSRSKLLDKLLYEGESLHSFKQIRFEGSAIDSQMMDTPKNQTRGQFSSKTSNSLIMIKGKKKINQYNNSQKERNDILKDETYDNIDQDLFRCDDMNLYNNCTINGKRSSTSQKSSSNRSYHTSRNRLYTKPDTEAKYSKQPTAITTPKIKVNKQGTRNRRDVLCKILFQKNKKAKERESGFLNPKLKEAANKICDRIIDPKRKYSGYNEGFKSMIFPKGLGTDTSKNSKFNVHQTEYSMKFKI